MGSKKEITGYPYQNRGGVKMYYIAIGKYDKECNGVKEDRFSDLLCPFDVALKAFNRLASFNAPVYLWTKVNEGSADEYPVIIARSEAYKEEIRKIID
jgi:hypothetical protein